MIGVITPTFNRPDDLVRLHASLCAGNRRDTWRHYVVNDGSSLDYAEAQARCLALSGPHGFTMATIANSGPLIARNHALDQALADGCSHVCFMDDDDEMLPGALDIVASRIARHPDAQWLLFRADKGNGDDARWPADAVTASWFDDVIRKRRFGSDNLIVLSRQAIGASRFSTRGRNQREWTFFLEISRRNDAILVCPETAIRKLYQAGGLTDQTRRSLSPPDQLANNVERAWCYWKRRPLDFRLISNLARQVVAFPLKSLRYHTAQFRPGS